MAAQSVRFSIHESPRTVNGGHGWTSQTARQWLQANGFRAPQGDRTANQIRFRQFPPGECQQESFTTLTEDLPRGVQIVDCDKVNADE